MGSTKHLQHNKQPEDEVRRVLTPALTSGLTQSLTPTPQLIPVPSAVAFRSGTSPDPNPTSASRLALTPILTSAPLSCFYRAPPPPLQP